MKIEKYTLENMMKMDSMHDCIVKEIKIEEDFLIIKYENLVNHIKNSDGNSCYRYDTLVVKYKCESELEIVLVSNEQKKRDVNFSELNRYLINYEIQSYKYSLDSFNELTLYFDLLNTTKKIKKKDFYLLEVTFYTNDIIYIWE